MATRVADVAHCVVVLSLAHIKPRLLGHWGTTPGLNFLYAHLNRVINAHDLNVIYVAGPGHGGPGIVYLPPDANTLLSVTDHCLRSRNYVNIVVAGTQPTPQWLNRG
jgi:phosphoketolase